MKVIKLFISFGLFTVASAQELPTPEPLVPYAKYFNANLISAPKLSPLGNFISYIAPDSTGVLNIWIAPADDLSKRELITNEKSDIRPNDAHGEATYRWTPDEKHILFLKDTKGDEHYHIWRVTLSEKSVQDLTPIDGITARLIAGSRILDDKILIGINDRGDHSLHDVYQVNIVSGERKLLLKNSGYVGYVADNTNSLRLALAFDGERYDVFSIDRSGKLKPSFSVDTENDEIVKNILGFNKNNTRIFTRDCRGRDKNALVAVNPENGEATVLGESELADISSVLIDPLSLEPQAYRVVYKTSEWYPVKTNPGLDKDLKLLREYRKGELKIDERSLDDKRWLVHFVTPDAPEIYYLYEKNSGKITELFNSNPELATLLLSDIYPFELKSDGFNLVGYYSIPHWMDQNKTGKPARPLPTIVVVHGGPGDERAEMGFAPLLQWFTNRGYAVVLVNFRGSPGFGKKFLNAGDMQWGLKMHEDVLAQTKWVVDAGIADQNHIAILGGSYGGYESLVGLTSTPDIFAAAVSIVGPANLVTFSRNIPPTWNKKDLARRIGDPDTEEGLAHLKLTSPYFHIDQIKSPLLLSLGANDSRVPRSEGDEMYKVMDEKNLKVTYTVDPLGGHLGSDSVYNSLAGIFIMEHFLAQHLGGRAEALDPELFKKMNLEIYGAKHIPALEEVLNSHR